VPTKDTHIWRGTTNEVFLCIPYGKGIPNFSMQWELQTRCRDFNMENDLESKNSKCG
jgi:hypothetical protein